jgi:arsenate reductase-like glutaredoxin family protein
MSGNYSDERIKNAVNYKTKEAGYAGMIDHTSKEWLKLSPAERKALFTQTTDEYKDINAALRADKKNKTAETIKQALSKQSLPNDMILMRGGTRDELLRFGINPDDMDKIRNLGNDFKKQGKLAKELLTGKEGVEKGFLSTGVGSSFGGNVLMEIFAPKGTQAMYSAPFSEFGGNGSKWDGIKGIKDFFESESEVLVNCGYKMRIKDVEYTKKGLAWELKLKIEIIGR